MWGLGSPSTPATPFAPSGNPIWDEIQQAHSGLSPAAQRAVAMSGVPQQAEQTEAAPMAAAPPQTEAQPLRPIAAPSSLSVRGLGSPRTTPTPEATAHVGELNRVTAAPLPDQIPRTRMDEAGNETFLRMSPNPLAHTSADTGRSGIGQVHNKFVRGLARVGDAFGSAFLPNLTAMIPGTELHHRGVVDQTEGIVNADVARAKSGAETDEAEARAQSLAHPAKEWEAGAEPEVDPAHPELGPQAVWYNKSDPTQKHFGGASVAAKPTTAEWGQGAEPEIDPAHPDLGPQAVWYNKQDPTKKQYGNAPVAAKPAAQAPHFQHIPGVGVVAITPSKDGKVGAEVVYREDPKVETELTDLEIGGKLHKVIVNKKDGAQIKDLGETRQPNAAGSDHGVTMIGPDGKVLRLAPGDTAPTGATTPTQAGSLNVPTAATRTMAEKAPRVLNFVERIGKLLDENESQLGPLASRWQEFTAGKVGLPNKGYTQLRTDLGLLHTALMNMHVGARGGEKIMEHFAAMIDGARQDPENLRAALGEIKIYAEEVAKENKRGAGEASGDGGGIPEVKTKAEFDALPKGAVYMEDGHKYKKP